MVFTISKFVADYSRGIQKPRCKSTSGSHTSSVTSLSKFSGPSVCILAGPGEVLDLTNESERLIVRIGLEGRARRLERLVWAGVHSLQIAYRLDGSEIRSARNNAFRYL